jgi:pyruvate,water dikinase
MIKRKIILKGIAASPGQVQGKVKIIKSEKDLLGVGRNNIIVASFLSPDACMMLKNNLTVAGLVTEKGGFTCHIAILARQLNLPYLAGAINCTKKLRNNSLACLDAKKGIVYEI